jgi:hypothetical protein
METIDVRIVMNKADGGDPGAKVMVYHTNEPLQVEPLDQDRQVVTVFSDDPFDQASGFYMELSIAAARHLAQAIFACLGAYQ